MTQVNIFQISDLQKDAPSNSSIERTSLTGISDIDEPLYEVNYIFDRKI